MLITWKTEELGSWKRHLIYGPEMMYTNKTLGKHKTTERANFEVCKKAGAYNSNFAVGMQAITRHVKSCKETVRTHQLLI